MPTYDYKCVECNYIFEVFQKMSDETLTECPECGGNIKRMIGAGLSPIFKGSGFYQTDYKNNSSKSETTNKNTSTEKSAKTENSSSTVSTESSKETKKAG